MLFLEKNSTIRIPKVYAAFWFDLDKPLYIGGDGFRAPGPNLRTNSGTDKDEYSVSESGTSTDSGTSKDEDSEEEEEIEKITKGFCLITEFIDGINCFDFYLKAINWFEKKDEDRRFDTGKVNPADAGENLPWNKEWLASRVGMLLGEQLHKLRSVKAPANCGFGRINNRCHSTEHRLVASPYDVEDYWGKYWGPFSYEEMVIRLIHR